MDASSLPRHTRVRDRHGCAACCWPLDLDHAGIVGQPVEQRRFDDGITEEFTQIGETLVQGQDHRATFARCIDQLEQQAAAGGDGKSPT